MLKGSNAINDAMRVRTVCGAHVGANHVRFEVQLHGAVVAPNVNRRALSAHLDVGQRRRKPSATQYMIQLRKKEARK